MELSEGKIGEVRGLLKGIRQIGSGNEDLEKMVDEIERILAPPLAQAMMELCNSIQGFRPQKAFHASCMPQFPRFKSLSDMIDTDPESVIFDIKCTWVYINFGVSLADSAVNLTVPELLKGIMSLRLHPGEWLNDWLLSKLLKVSHMEIIDAVQGKVSDLLRMRLAEVFGYAGEADKSADSGPGKASSDAKDAEGHTSTPPAKNGLPDGEYLVTEARDKNGKIVERKIEPLASTGKTPAAPEEAPKKRGRKKKPASPATPAAPAAPTPMSSAEVTRGCARVLRLIRERNPPDVPTLVRACVDDGFSVNDLSALTGISYFTLAKCRTERVTAPTVARFQKIFAFPRPPRNNISEEV